ncbi:uncharacterized protein LOC130454064 isoform X2 [Monodelphis domestica]|uniref:uncharacterized protein LOC130454064 isoform X2 n=1 Tax=Monodelphis domestica TaxID=13616 RepID=UPI0024E21BF7|nr:uncharacterized protein LOC130454064 isoform X2 [Monodelphis domestica]
MSESAYGVRKRVVIPFYPSNYPAGEPYYSPHFTDDVTALARGGVGTALVFPASDSAILGVPPRALLRHGMYHCGTGGGEFWTGHTGQGGASIRASTFLTGRNISKGLAQRQASVGVTYVLILLLSFDVQREGTILGIGSSTLDRTIGQAMGGAGICVRGIGDWRKGILRCLVGYMIIIKEEHQQLFIGTRAISKSALCVLSKYQCITNLIKAFACHSQTEGENGFQVDQ